MSQEDDVFFAVGRAWDEQMERFALLGEKATENQLIEMLIASAALLNEYSERDARHMDALATGKAQCAVFAGLSVFLAAIIIWLGVR